MQINTLNKQQLLILIIAKFIWNWAIFTSNRKNIAGEFPIIKRQLNLIRSIRNLKQGDSYHIAPLTVHQMEAVVSTDLLEASTPEIDDVVRLEDRYGRV